MGSDERQQYMDDLFGVESVDKQRIRENLIQDNKWGINVGPNEWGHAA